MPRTTARGSPCIAVRYGRTGTKGGYFVSHARRSHRAHDNPLPSPCESVPGGSPIHSDGEEVEHETIHRQ
jgi:hypothetical protein